MQYHTGVQTPEWKPRLVWSCLGLYIVFLTALEFKQELWGLVIVAAGFALLAIKFASDPGNNPKPPTFTAHTSNKDGGT